MIRRWFANLSVKAKLIAIAMLTTFLSLQVNLIATAALDFWLFRYSLRENISIQASIIADSSTAPLIFNDNKEATTVLETLKKNPAVVTGIIYDENDLIFAQFRRDKDRSIPPTPPPLGKSYLYRDNILHILYPVILDKTKIGSVYLQSDISVFYSWMQWTALISFAILLLSLGVAALLSRRLQQMISVPLHRLTRTMEKVTQQGDYALRLSLTSSDEIGRLASGFNDMLGHIQQKDKILKKSEEKYRHFFENSEMGIFRLQIEGSAFLAVNHKLSKMLGCSVDKLITGSPFSLWGGEEHYRHFADLLTRKTIVSNYEKQVVGFDGIKRIFLFSAKFYAKERVVEGFVVDITRLRTTEDRLEKQACLAHTGRLTAMGEMATGIAHEINQPLTIISLAVQFLQAKLNNSPDSRIHESLAKIYTQVKRASNIITNMRSFARASGDNMSLIALDEPVTEALSFFQEQFRLYQVHLHFNQQPDLPKVKADPQKIEQIVVNFLSNARYAVEQKEQKSPADYRKEISVSLFVDRDRQAVILEINDNGTGMTPDVLDRCLDPFYTTKKVGEGTGLGLLIVHNLVRELNGTLEINSIDGEGSCFRVLFPLV